MEHRERRVSEQPIGGSAQVGRATASSLIQQGRPSLRLAAVNGLEGVTGLLAVDLRAYMESTAFGTRRLCTRSIGGKELRGNL
jgi:hypothetical protein